MVMTANASPGKSLVQKARQFTSSSLIFGVMKSSCCLLSVNICSCTRAFSDVIVMAAVICGGCQLGSDLSAGQAKSVIR